MPIETIAENLKGFRAKYGVYAVIGNHDWWYDDKKVQSELERAGFYACTLDLEDELTRAVGPAGMERVLSEQGELRAFRTYQRQPAHRDRSLEEQLHGFMWNRKQRYAVLLVEALALERIPPPLDRVLAHLAQAK